jgi:protein-tyrosine phosphatase
MPVRVCFVCVANYCRSPMAEGVLQAQVTEAGLDGVIEVESAGIGDWFAGELPDPRARAATAQRGIELSSRCRLFEPEDFDRFDYVLALDRSVHARLVALGRTDAHREQLHLLRSFEKPPPPSLDVPDPYGGGPADFERALDICERAVSGFLERLRHERGC